MMWKALSILAVFVVAGTASTVNLTHSSDTVGVNRKPSTASKLIITDTFSECSAKCALRPTCLSFYTGNGECGLYDTTYEAGSLTEAPGYNYYRLVTPGRDPKVVCQCPLRNPSPQEYRNINGRRVAHKICTSPVPLFRAMDACKCTGGRLVAIPDNETQAAIDELINSTPKKGGPPYIWIGFNGTTKAKPDPPYTLQRSDGKILTQDTKDMFVNFDKGFPVFPHPQIQKGITVNWAKPVGKWRDFYNTDNYAFICEYL